MTQEGTRSESGATTGNRVTSQPFTWGSSVLWTSHSDSDQSNHVSTSQCQALQQKPKTAMERTQFLVRAQSGERRNMNPQ